MALFADAGLAWTSATRPRVRRRRSRVGEKRRRRLALNVLGFAIAEIDFVRPLDRSRKGWLWQFGLTPGF